LLRNRISEWEKKVGAFESARVLPEIVLPAKDEPTPNQLPQEIRVAERKREIAAEAAEERAKAAPQVSISQSGFALSSADTNYVLKIKGLLQADSRTFFNDNLLSKGNDSFLLRRARPIFEGTLFHDLDYLFVPDFGGSSPAIVDAYLNYRLDKALQLRAGNFKAHWVVGNSRAFCLRLQPGQAGVRTVHLLTLIWSAWEGWGNFSPSLPLESVGTCFPEVSTCGTWQVIQ
jgi:hypothetical protein